MPVANAAISNGRRLLGAGALIATAGGLATIALHDVHWVEWGLLACSGVVAAAGVGLARRSMVAQVLSRGAAWCVLAPAVMTTAASTLWGHPDWTAAAFAVGSGGALLLARPMQHTAAAKAEFGPSSFRRWLLAGATTSVSAGLVSGLFALDGLRWHAASAIALGVLGLSLIASAIGVVRMRAWGILLGALTSVIALIAGAVMHDVAGFVLALTSIPGLMLVLPVLVAQRGRARPDARSLARIASPTDAADATSPRVRVAVASTGNLDDEFDQASDEPIAARAPAMRAQA